MRRVPYVTTVGHGMLFSVYIAINVAVTVTLVKWDDSILTLIAKRLGWYVCLFLSTFRLWIDFGVCCAFEFWCTVNLDFVISDDGD